MVDDDSVLEGGTKAGPILPAAGVQFEQYIRAVIANPGRGNNSIIEHGIKKDAVLTVPFNSGRFAALVSYKDKNQPWNNLFQPLFSGLWGMT